MGFFGSAIVAVILAQAVPVSGIVRADSTLVPIPDVTIELVGGARRTISDARGRFFMPGVPQGRWTLRATAIGYDTAMAEVVVGEVAPAAVELRLQRRPVALSGLNVEVLRLPSVGPPRVKLDMEMLSEIPALVEVDVLRALEILPSVSAASDYSAALYVRGGTPDQTDILLDGFPVFNPYHLGGLYAAFSPDAVGSVVVFPGAMTADRGTRISSVVTVETREGGEDRVRARGTVSLTSLAAAFDGPMPALPGTFLVSGRQALRNFAGGGVSAEGIVPKSMDVDFQDVLAKWSVPWSGGAAEALAFWTREGMSLPSDEVAKHDWTWGSRLIGLSSYVALGSSARLEARLASSTFDTSLGTWWEPFYIDRREQTARATGAMEDRLGSLELIVTRAGHRVALGAELRRSTMEYDATRTEDPPGGLWNEFVPRFSDSFSTSVAHTWLEDELRIGRFGLRAGARTVTAFGVGTSVQPRAGLSVSVASWLALTAGAGRYVQPVHSIRVEEAIGTSFMAFDLFRPATEATGLPTARDVVIGAEVRLGPASLRVDGYRKRYDVLVLPDLPLDPWHAAVVEPTRFLRGSGRSDGLDVSAEYVTSPLGIWLSYAYLKGTRSAAAHTYTPRFERRHTADLMTAVTLPDGLRLNARAVYGTGQPSTPVIGRIEAPRWSPELGGFNDSRAGRRVLLGEHNSIRLPAYVRVDLGGRIKFRRDVLGQATDLAFFAELVNVLNITNTLYWDPSTTPAAADDPSWQLPPTLTAGFEWSF